MVARLEIFHPNAALSAKVAVIQESTELELTSLGELGGVTVSDTLEDGVLSVTRSSVQPRVYTITAGAVDRETAATLDYFRILQNQGDASIPLTEQSGVLRVRDFCYQINEIETGLYQRTIPTGSTTETVGTETLRCGIEMPIYLEYPAGFRSILGNYGESIEITLYERVAPLPSEITTQLTGTIRVSYGAEFSVDFTKLSNPYVRQPVFNPEIDYALSQSWSTTGVVTGNSKQEWVIQAEISKTQLTELRSLLSRWRSNGGNITLSDLTSEIAEPTPRTRAIASGVEDISGAITRYFGSFNAGQSGQLEVTPVDGSSDNVNASVTFRELDASG